MTDVYIPNSVTEIGDGAFDTGYHMRGSDKKVYNVTIHCEKGSYAEKYAIKLGIEYKFCDDEKNTDDNEKNNNESTVENDNRTIQVLQTESYQQEKMHTPIKVKNVTVKNIKKGSFTVS